MFTRRGQGVFSGGCSPRAHPVNRFTNTHHFLLSCQTTTQPVSIHKIIRVFRYLNVWVFKLSTTQLRALSHLVSKSSTSSLNSWPLLSWSSAILTPWWVCLRI